MTSARSRSRGTESDRFAGDPLACAPQARGGHDTDCTAEQVLQDRPSDAACVNRLAPRHVNQYVEVPCLVTSPRTTDPTPAVRAMTRRNPLDLIARTTQLLKHRRWRARIGIRSTRVPELGEPFAMWGVDGQTTLPMSPCESATFSPRHPGCDPDAARTIAAILTIRDHVLAPLVAGVRTPHDEVARPSTGPTSTATTKPSGSPCKPPSAISASPPTRLHRQDLVEHLAARR
jgi:hypothetical protein